jgi:hypothetical protein
MASILPLLLAAAGLLLVLWQREKFSSRAALLLLWLPSLINISALYWGMIYRVRYSILLEPAVAIFGSIVITSEVVRKRAFMLLLATAAVLPWLSWHYARTNSWDKLLPGPGALLLPVAGLILFMLAQAVRQERWPLLLFCILGMQIPLLARESRPILAETLEHEFIEPERQQIMQYIRQHYDGKRILIDMGKQAPLVYDSGLNVKEFVYNEGGETLWHEALKNPASQVGWLCTQVGDAIWEQLQVDPGWADAYSLAVKTESLSLYRLKR